nr:MAG TPA: hypothetical protein [Caudoviricetes sp.]
MKGITHTPYIPFPLTAGIVPIGNRPDFCYTARK